RVSRIAIEGVAEAGFGARLVAGRRARCGLPGEPVRFGGEDRLQEPPHERLRRRGGRLLDQRPVAQLAPRRYALHAELPAGDGILVGVELGKQHGSTELVDEALEHGREHATRSAPRRPYVDDDRRLQRARDDVAREVLFGRVEHPRRAPHAIHVAARAGWRQARVPDRLTALRSAPYKEVP